MVADTGIKHVELVAVSPERHLDVRTADPKTVNKLFADHGLSVMGLYPPPLSMKDKRELDESLRSCCRAVDFAEALNCQRIIFSPLFFWEKKDYPFEDLAKALRTLVEYIGDRDVILCLENHYGWPLSDAEDYRRLFALIDTHKIAITADTGHFLPAGVDVNAFLAEFRHKVRHIHIKDQDGTDGRRLGEGAVNFDRVLAQLKAIKYKGFLTIELETGENGKGPEQDFRDAVTYLQRKLG